MYKFLKRLIIFCGILIILPIKIVTPLSNSVTSEILETNSETLLSAAGDNLNVNLSNNDVKQLRQSDVKVRSVKNDVPDGNGQEQKFFGNVREEYLERIIKGIASVDTKKCQRDLNATLEGYLQGASWAIGMYDASVKEPVGIEYGVTYHLGNFDQCVAIRSKGETTTTAIVSNGGSSHHQIDDITAQYCLADVTMDGYTVRSLASRRHQTNSTLIHWGICMPASCTMEDVKKFLTTVTGHTKVEINEDSCYKKEPLKLTTYDILYGCIMMGFLLIVLFSSVFHFILMQQEKRGGKLQGHGLFVDLMKSFSFLENLRKLIKDGNNDLGLSCINGIKSISMLFIVAGHALLFMVGGPVQNAIFFKNESEYIQNAFLLNSPLLVDTFLLLSGFLFARLLLLELEKRKGKINFGLLYIFRYIRLTPAYLAVMALYATLLPKLGSGPLWNQKMVVEQTRCLNSWWKNLLYINNYIGTDNLCMFQSWYLAADTQLFILAPLLLYPLWRWRKIGLSLLVTSSIISVLIPFGITLYEKLDPTFLVFADEIQDLAKNEYFINTYIKTHMRVTAYIFGLLTGFFVHYIQEKNIQIPKYLQLICWITAIGGGLGSMFSVVVFYNPDYRYTIMESAIYAGLHRLGWSFITGWIVLACVIGYAGPMKKILSSPILVPFSRLTYCAYLTNGLVELYQAGILRTPKYLSIMNLLGDTLSHVCLTFLAALILCLMFESPIHGIEKILLRRDKAKEKHNSHSPSTSEESA